MEPQIKYAITEDGASIAYWTLGEGRPLIWPSGGFGTNSLRAWHTPEGRQFFERLAARRMVVRYDYRGSGNSPAGTADFSIESRTRDLAAVVERVGSDTVDLVGYLGSGSSVLAFAAMQPARVSRLVTWGATTKGMVIGEPRVGGSVGGADKARPRPGTGGLDFTHRAPTWYRPGF